MKWFWGRLMRPSEHDLKKNRIICRLFLTVRGLKLLQSKILPKVHLPSVVPAQFQVVENFSALIIKHMELKPAKPRGALLGNGIFTGSLRRSIVPVPTKL